MIIFGSILTTFELSSNFGGRSGSIENGLKPKTEQPSGNFSLPKFVTRYVESQFLQTKKNREFPNSFILVLNSLITSKIKTIYCTLTYITELHII